MNNPLARYTQVLTEQEELLIAIDAGYVDRAAAQADLDKLNAVLAQF